MKSIWIDLHLLLWKHLVALLVKIELEGAKYDEAQVWAPAWKRIERKVLTLRERVSQAKRRRESRGDLPEDLRHWSKITEPLGVFDEHGKFTWDDGLVNKIKLFGKSEEVSAARRRQQHNRRT